MSALNEESLPTISRVPVRNPNVPSTSRELDTRHYIVFDLSDDDVVFNGQLHRFDFVGGTRATA